MCLAIARAVGDAFKVMGTYKTMQVCAIVQPDQLGQVTQQDEHIWAQLQFEIRHNEGKFGVQIMIKNSYLSTQLDKVMLNLVVKTMRKNSLAIAIHPNN